MIIKLSEEELDPKVKEFFISLKELLSNKDLNQIIRRVLEVRPNVSTEHLAYLLYISLQYLTDFSYDSGAIKDKIEKDILNNKEEIIDLCSTKYASTNIIERYSLLEIISGIFNKKVRILDIGTSISLGLMGLNKNKYENVDMKSDLRNRLGKAKIEMLFGMDIQRPDMKWQLACYLPMYKRQREELLKLYESLKKNGNEIIMTIQDALEKITASNIDIAWTSSMIYQLEGDKKKLINNIRNCLSDKGIWIDADYRYQYEKMGTPENPFVAKVRFKKDWNNELEVLEADNDEVGILKLGKDFNKFVEIVAKN